MFFPRLRDLREDAELTQQQVADVLNMSRAGYQNYEKGDREIPAWAVVKLAEHYKTTSDYILGLSRKRGR